MTQRDSASEIRWSDGIRFAIVPEWIITHPELSAQSVRVYALLALHANAQGNSMHTRKALAETLHIGTSTLDERLRELRDQGAVTTETRQRLDGSYTSSNYWVHATPPALDSRDTPPGKPGHPSRETGHHELERSELDVVASSEATTGDDVRAVFAHWQTILDKAGCKLTPNRRDKIKTRLERFSVDQLKRAIEGVLFDPWPERLSFKASDLTVLFRNDEQVEKFLDLYERRPAPQRRRLTGREVRERALARSRSSSS